MLTALLASALLSATSDEAPSPPPLAALSQPIAYPTWSLGVGAFYDVERSVGSSVVTGAPPVTPSVSLERAFSRQFAFGFGFQGTYQSTQAGSADAPFGTIGFSLSPRFVLTEPDAPVSFTFFTTAMLGYGAGTMSFGLATPSAQLTAITGSVSGGGALELKLLERLALRVQASFVRFSVSRSSVRLTTGEAASTTVGVSVIPLPGLELRVYL